MMASYPDLAGKRILVTGASSGIGRAIAVALGQQNADLVLTGRNMDALVETNGLLATAGTVISADLTLADERSQLLDAVDDLDGCCHCAGIIDPVPVRFIGRQGMSDLVDINFQAPVMLTSSILERRQMKQGGAFVFLSSVSSRYCYKGGASYSASKAAIEAFSRGVAIENAAMAIRANCIRAAMVKTAIYERTERFFSTELMEQHVERYPLGVGRAEDVASATLFLLSDASRWMTGTILTLDGGLTAGA